MNMPYILVGHHRVDVHDILTKILGLDRELTSEELDEVIKNTPVQLCLDTTVGTLIATPENACDEYPCIELMLNTPVSGDPPVLLARADHDETGSLAPITSPNVFLYGRGDSYIAYMPVDTRSDAAVEKDPHGPVIVASGDPDQKVVVQKENQYVEVRDVPRLPGM